MKNIILELKKAREKCANVCDKENLKVLDEQISELESLSKEQSKASYFSLIERAVKLFAVIRFIYERFIDG